MSQSGYTKRLRTLLVFIFFIAIFFIDNHRFESSVYGSSQPAFFMGTDKSFGSTERPYVNLEGPGTRNYDFRIYRIDNPGSFLLEKVKERLVKEKNETAYGNPSRYNSHVESSGKIIQ